MILPEGTTVRLWPVANLSRPMPEGIGDSRETTQAVWWRRCLQVVFVPWAQYAVH
jgi:hypothetical protein